MRTKTWARGLPELSRDLKVEQEYHEEWGLPEDQGEKKEEISQEDTGDLYFYKNNCCFCCFDGF